MRFLSQVKISLAGRSHQINLEYFVKRGWGKQRLNFGIVRRDLVSAEARQ